MTDHENSSIPAEVDHYYDPEHEDVEYGEDAVEITIPRQEFEEATENAPFLRTLYWWFWSPVKLHKRIAWDVAKALAGLEVALRRRRND